MTWLSSGLLASLHQHAIIAEDMVKYNTIRFSQRLLPYNFAIGANGGTNYTIKTMQSSIKMFITKPDEDFYANIKNMFNSVAEKI